MVIGNPMASDTSVEIGLLLASGMSLVIVSEVW